MVNAETVNDRAKLLIHLIAARRLRADPSVLSEARTALQRQKERNGPSPLLDKWEHILRLPPAEIADLVVRRDPEMDRLRLVSPFGLVIPEIRGAGVRRGIWRDARNALEAEERDESVYEAGIPLTR
jgi:hypothetical protein